MKKFHKNLSGRWQKALVIGAAMLSLGTPQAHADGFLEKIGKVLYKVGEIGDKINDTVNQNLVIPTANIKHEVGRVGRNFERLDNNTGGLIGGAVNAVQVHRAQKQIQKAIEESGGTYYASVEEFSQSANQQSSNYANEVRAKKSKLTQSKATKTSSVQTPVTKKKTYSTDVQTVLNILNSNQGQRK